jgi:hypothetical protein
MPNCEICHRPLNTARFVVAHYDRTGKALFGGNFCSLLCIGKWLAQYAIVMSRKGIVRVLQSLPTVTKGK